MVYIVLVSLMWPSNKLHFFTSTFIINFGQELSAKAEYFVSLVNIVTDIFCIQVQTLTL